jgi:hypothetical protein
VDLQALAAEYVSFIESVKEASALDSGVALMGEYGALTGATAILGRVNTLRRLSESVKRKERWEQFEWYVRQERRRRESSQIGTKMMHEGDDSGILRIEE